MGSIFVRRLALGKLQSLDCVLKPSRVVDLLAFVLTKILVESISGFFSKRIDCRASIFSIYKDGLYRILSAFYQKILTILERYLYNRTAWDSAIESISTARRTGSCQQWWVRMLFSSTRLAYGFQEYVAMNAASNGAR